jgi:hypothetical protein
MVAAVSERRDTMHDFTDCLKDLDEAREKLELDGALELWLAQRYDEIRNRLGPMPCPQEKLYELCLETLRMGRFLAVLLLWCCKRAGSSGSATSAVRKLLAVQCDLYNKVEKACISAGDYRVIEALQRALKGWVEQDPGLFNMPMPRDVPEGPNDQV